MTKERKHYEASFKEHAVKLSYERSNLSELAKELGISHSLFIAGEKRPIVLVQVASLGTVSPN